TGLTDRQRDRFDALVEEVLDGLSPQLRDLLDEAPLIVEDEPEPRLLGLLGMATDDADLLCGLHTGTPLTERSVEAAGELPEMIHLFRTGIIEHAGGWLVQPGPGRTRGGVEAIREEIRITLLHELGHHFGLEDEDLERLGYG
ncbi:MAG: metallopeptidase family protein, partial [Planctomycetota bacterium]